MRGHLSLLLGLAAAKWSPGTIDASDKPLVIVYYDEWAIWEQGFSVTEMEKVLLSREMPVRNWVINLGFLQWSYESCYLVPTDAEAGWAKSNGDMFPGQSGWWDGSRGWGVPGGNIPSLLALKQKYPYILIMLSVGGWSMSHSFARCVREHPDHMIQSAKDFLYYFDFDGIDLDWEYPSCPGPNGKALCGCQDEPVCNKWGTYNQAQADDWAVYTRFVDNFRRELDDLEDLMEKKLYLTAAIGMNPNHIDGKDPWVEPLPVEWICGDTGFDWVNLMTYDYYGPWRAKTGHLSPLYKSTAPDADADQVSVDDSMQRVLARCKRPEKLTIGLAAYGKGWAKVPRGSGPVPGLWQSSANTVAENINTQKSYGPFMSYELGTVVHWDIIKNVLTDPNCKRTYDEEAQAPTIYCSRYPKAQQAGQDDLANDVFISYDDRESWKAKLAYARQHGMAGAIIWAASMTGHTSKNEESAADLYGGLFEGWYGSPQTIGPVGANGQYTFAGIKAGDLPSAVTCPYANIRAAPGFNQPNYLKNPCYEPEPAAQYVGSWCYPIAEGTGKQDLVGKDVIIITSSGTPPSPPVTPRPTSRPATTSASTAAPTTKVRTTESSSVASSTSSSKNVVCTLPPECEGHMDTEPIGTTASTPSGGEDELAACKAGINRSSTWTQFCETRCDYFNQYRDFCPSATMSLLECVLALQSYCA